MSSPVLFSLKANIQLHRNSDRKLYLQLTDQIIGWIKAGILPPGTKLPGTRKLAEDLHIHRKTVIAAYDELVIQSWLVSVPASGTFVNQRLPIVHAQEFNGTTTTIARSSSGNFPFQYQEYSTRCFKNSGQLPHFIDEGVPDHRLAPIDDIARTYRNIAKKSYYKNLLAYSSPYGNQELRRVLADYLNTTRGLHITSDNVLITRGSQMGIYLASQLVLFPDAKIVIGNTNYRTADITFEHCKASLVRVPVDDQGIVTDAIATLCRATPITAVYVTSHHHHPTTVTLSAQRRMELLQLAQHYKFAIIEDDYDYDFHYANTPILPLASSDYAGNVIYIGAFTKMIAPALRIGYFIAAKEVVDAAAQLRYGIDRQGDNLLEQSIAIMLRDGDVQRQTAKVLKQYRARRDLFCSLLKEEMNEYLTFEIPKGGMAVWVILHKNYSWRSVAKVGKSLGLQLPDWKRYDAAQSGHNGIRLGFASLTIEEIPKVIRLLAQSIKASVP